MLHGFAQRAMHGTNMSRIDQTVEAPIGMSRHELAKRADAVKAGCPRIRADSEAVGQRHKQTGVKGCLSNSQVISLMTLIANSQSILLRLCGTPMH